MGLVLKFAILFFCIRHVLTRGRPGLTAFIYAGAFLALGLVAGLLSGKGGYGLLPVLIYFPIDVATGFLFFWLLERYQADLLWFYGIIVAGILINIAFYFWLSGVSFPESEDEPLVPENPVAQTYGSPPHLWSHHKRLDIPADVCALRGAAALKALKLTSIVRTGTYVYGNSGSNRAVVKCVEQGPMSSFLYLAVAGPVKEDVERLRNEIAWKM